MVDSRQFSSRALALANSVLALAVLACGAAIAEPGTTDQPQPARTSNATATATPTTSASAIPTASPPPDDSRRSSFALDPDGLPGGAIGPLLVYRAVIGDPISFGLGSPSPEVVIYDIGANAELTRIWIGNPGRQPQASALVSPYLVINFGNALWRYPFDGVHELLFEPGDAVITALAADSSAGLVVIATQARLDAPVTLTWIEVATGEVLRVAGPLTLTDGNGSPLPRVIGRPTEPVLLRGTTYSDRAGGYAVLETDETARELAVRGFAVPAPDGRHVAHGPGIRCEDIGGQTVEVTSVATGETVAVYTDPEASLAPWDWSPDGTELAIRSRPLLAGSDCANTQPAPQWLVLGIDGSVRSVDSPLTLRSEWYQERAVTFRCGNLLDAGWFSRRDGLQRPSDCLRFDVEILVGGQPIATEPTATILGFIEP